MILDNFLSQNNFIIREICKRRLHPLIAGIRLLLFFPHFFNYLFKTFNFYNIIFITTRTETAQTMANSESHEKSSEIHEKVIILRFILPCKNDWHSILEKARHLLTFCKIGTCKAPDFKYSWFFSLIPFKCHLRTKSNISDEREVRFWKIYFFLLDLKGGKYWCYAISHAIYACF